MYIFKFSNCIKIILIFCAFFVWGHLASAEIKTWIITSQSDWEAGLIPSSLNTVKLPGSLILSREEIIKSGENFFDKGLFRDNDKLSNTMLSEEKVILGNYFNFDNKTSIFLGEAGENESNIIYDIYYATTTGIVYISTGVGLTAINTNKTFNPNDDQRLFNYSNENRFISQYPVFSSFYDDISGLIYISTSGGIAVVDTKKTIDPFDDELFTTYPGALFGGSNTYSLFLENNLLFVSTDSGLVVINVNTQNRYTGDYYSGTKIYSSYFDNSKKYLFINSENGLIIYDWLEDTEIALIDSTYFEPILDNNVKHSFLYDDKYIFIATPKGLTLMNLGDLSSVGDDLVISNFVTYWQPSIDKMNSIFLPSNFVKHSYLTNNLLYISTQGGVMVVDLGNLENPNDDILKSYYNAASKVSTNNDSINKVIEINGGIYIATNGGGVTGIKQDNNFLFGNFYAMPVNNSNIISLSASGVINEDQDLKIFGRFGANKNYWRDDFEDDNIDNINTNPFGGEHFQSVSENDGLLKLSYLDSFGGGNGNLYINTGIVFPAGSKILLKARHVGLAEEVKIGINDTSGQPDNMYYFINNNWSYLEKTVLEEFNSEDIYIYVESGPYWDNDSDYIEIDWVAVKAPDNYWTEWISGTDLNSISTTTYKWIQAKVNLSSLSENFSPQLLTITYNKNYISTGEYLSKIFDAGREAEWQTIFFDIYKPENTNVIFYTRSGSLLNSEFNWSDWVEATSSNLYLPQNRYFQFKAILSTDNLVMTPIINSVNINYKLLNFGGGGSSGVILSFDNQSKIKEKPPIINRQLFYEQFEEKQEFTKDNQLKQSWEVKGMKLSWEEQLKIAALKISSGVFWGRRNLNQEKEVFQKYTTLMIKNKKGIKKENIFALTNFIVYGSGFSDGVSFSGRIKILENYIEYYGNIPMDKNDWENILKMAQRIQPSLSLLAAQKANIDFKRIYGRNANLKNKDDINALKIIISGITGVGDDSEKEKEAKTIFRWIFNRNPDEEKDINIIKVIAYASVKK